MDDKEDYRKALESDAKAYAKLSKIKDSTEFQAYFDHQIEIVTQQMIMAFASDKVNSWDDYCKVRGEIIARLQPIQEVYDADKLAAQTKEQIKNFYTIDQT